MIGLFRYPTFYPAFRPSLAQAFHLDVQISVAPPGVAAVIVVVLSPLVIAGFPGDGAAIAVAEPPGNAVRIVAAWSPLGIVA